MPSQAPEERVKNFNEVALGYTEEQALIEASRCLGCKKPLCVEGCPVDIDIPAFIKFIQEKEYQKAIEKIKEKNNLPAICGRVCPQENQCEKRCVLGKKAEPVAIGRLERFVADWELKNGSSRVKETSVSGKKVAIVGSGPAGLTAAADLAMLGHKVTIFEALHTPGGVLVYGIPEFRLPKAIVQQEIDNIEKLGVEIKTNMVVGKINTVDELLDSGYDAVFVGTGAGLPYFMDIPGENFNGVYSANEFLTRVNLMKAYLFPEYLTPIRIGKKVAVIGAGNVAMDSARTALRLGAEESYIVYRRSEKEMPARKEEIEHAREEGVQFRLLTSPVAILGDENGWVKSMVCQQFELGEPDESGRRKPVPIQGSEYEMEVDTVIMAIGQGPNPLVPQTTPDLEINAKGNIIADDRTCETSKKGVFAGGDIVTGAATVIQAMGAGKKAARAIDKYLSDG
ncbi:MAG: NADPH-dependent glutamate synthase [Syntrophomonadaceae bacterium]|nr:NADPH-dependent glutamate synthase [Syntrophomonadaceae bacterium]